jgi:dihydroorotate dehydrogenase (NAD+) catalytic subunit
MDDEPLTLGILERGQFTRAITSLREGDSFYVRGPYGTQVNPLHHFQHIGLVGGGCGIAGIYMLAKQFSKQNNVDIFLGAKDKEHIPYLEKFEKFGQVHVATEDGSLGKEGLVTDLMRDTLVEFGPEYFFNCGPRKMIEAVLPIERRSATDANIYSSVDYMTRCGVGICGSCADEKGRRTCVEGPFMNA